MTTFDTGPLFDSDGFYDYLTPPPPPPPGAPPSAATFAAATDELYDALGPIPTLGDGDEAAGWPLRRYIDGLGQILQRIIDLSADTPTGEPGWSIILDPARCPTYALPWLAQLVGVRFTAAQDTDARQRAAIRAEQGFNRGSIAALEAAIAPYLAAGSLPVIVERDTSAYHLTVEIVGSYLGAAFYYLLDGEYGTYTALDGAFATYEAMQVPTATLLAVIEAAVPGGLQVALSIVTALPYLSLDGAYGTYSALDAAFATYAAMSAYH